MKSTNYILWIQQVAANMRAMVPTDHIRSFFDKEGRMQKVDAAGVVRSVAGDALAEIRNVSGDDTITEADNGKVLVVAAGDPRNLTVSGTIPVGFNCLVMRNGDSDVLIDWPDGNLSSLSGDFILIEDFAVATLLCYASGSILVTGNI
jgi:hypothetical protein